MSRFKASKYKNANPKIPRKAEGWVLDISVGSPHSFGNNIAASAAFVAFCTDSRCGGSLGVLSINDVGRKGRNLPLLPAHSELISDFDFSPFDDGILATGSHDCCVKVWRLGCEGTKVILPQNPEVSLPSFQSRVEGVLFHPSVDSILCTATSKNIVLWDVTKSAQIATHQYHNDVVQSSSWKSDGTTLASMARDQMIKIWDPRNNRLALETTGHPNTRDGRVLWLGDSDFILSTGFGHSREREVALRDVRNFNKILKEVSGETSLGILIPLYDEDTKMIFLAAKGDTTLNFWELLNNDPYFGEGLKHVGDVQVKGIGLVPKRALRVMEGEVNRVLLLGPDCIVPVSYQVPRKTYRDFHGDIFPDTKGPMPALSLQDWFSGKNAPVSKMSLDPAKTPREGLLKFGHKFGSLIPKVVEAKVDKEKANKSNNRDEIAEKNVFNKPSLPPKPAVGVKSAPQVGPQNTAPLTTKQLTPLTSKMSKVPASTHSSSSGDAKPQEQNSAPRRGRFAVRVTKFRHLNGTLLPRETHITNLTKVSKAIPSESDGFEANVERVAVPLSGDGGHIAILELSSRGRLKSGVLPRIICGTAVMDFAWDPFDNHRLAVACDDGQIQLWHIPENGLENSLTEPEFALRGHTEKVQIVKFHPSAKDVLASSSHDFSVVLWDLVDGSQQIVLAGHTDQIFSLAWSPDGQLLATLCKDQKLRVYNPRTSSEPFLEGPGPQGSRGARVVWVLGGTHLLVTGFSRVSERLVNLYSMKNIDSPLASEGIDVSPAILVPFYDEDSSTIFLTGKGDSTIFAFEVATDSPFLHPLSHCKCSGPHQAVSFVPKYVCDVAAVEFAKAFRLTSATVEPISFTVPRLRKEYFQDDIFPMTRVTWKPVLSSGEWFSGLNRDVPLTSLRPDEMALLSDAPDVKPSSLQPMPKTPADQNDVQLQFEGDLVLESSLAFLNSSKDTEERLVQAMKDNCQFDNDEKLPQDSFDGVDPEEWDDEGTQV